MHSLNHDEANALDGLTTLLAAWVKTLDKESRSLCDQVIMLEGRNSLDDDPICMFELLAIPKERPVMQFVVHCVVLSETLEPGPCVCAEPDYPFELRMVDRKWRLGSTAGNQFTTLDIATSDELCKFLLSLKSDWTIFPIATAICVTRPTLIDMTAFGRGEAFLPERKTTARRKPVPFNLPKEFDVGDPVLFGSESSAPVSIGFETMHVLRMLFLARQRKILICLLMFHQTCVTISSKL